MPMVGYRGEWGNVGPTIGMLINILMQDICQISDTKFVAIFYENYTLIIYVIRYLHHNRVFLLQCFILSPNALCVEYFM